MLQEVYWVSGSRVVQLSQAKRPTRVWTLYEHLDPESRPSLPMTPIHLQGFFSEDYVHDWKFNEKTKVLRYYSRVIESGCWILVEYGS